MRNLSSKGDRDVEANRNSGSTKEPKRQTQRPRTLREVVEANDREIADARRKLWSLAMSVASGQPEDGDLVFSLLTMLEATPALWEDWKERAGCAVNADALRSQLKQLISEINECERMIPSNVGYQPTNLMSGYGILGGGEADA